MCDRPFIYPKQHWFSSGQTINEFYVKQIASDRVHFMPIVPAPFARGKYMTVLER